MNFLTQKEIEEFSKELAVDLAISGASAPSVIRAVDKVNSFLHSTRAADKEAVTRAIEKLENRQIYSDNYPMEPQHSAVEEFKNRLLTHLKDNWIV